MSKIISVKSIENLYLTLFIFAAKLKSQRMFPGVQYQDFDILVHVYT